jgi:hypothetical protein
MENQVDINSVINEFKAIIADQAQVIAILRATVISLQSNANPSSSTPSSDGQ